MADPPVLNEAEIEYLLAVEKPVEDIGWRTALAPPPQDAGHVMKGYLDLLDLPDTAPLRGRLHLYSRRGKHRGLVRMARLAGEPLEA